MVLHEFPEGIVTYVLLRRSGFSDHSSFHWAFIAAGLTTPLGMVLTYPFVAELNHYRLTPVICGRIWGIPARVFRPGMCWRRPL
jgi:zinc transporter ZupT